MAAVSSPGRGLRQSQRVPGRMRAVEHRIDGPSGGGAWARMAA